MNINTANFKQIKGVISTVRKALEIKKQEGLIVSFYPTRPPKVTPSTSKSFAPLPRRTASKIMVFRFLEMHLRVKTLNPDILSIPLLGKTIPQVLTIIHHHHPS